MQKESMNTPFRPRIVLFAVLMTLSMLFTGCDSQLLKNDLEVIKARGELTVITRNNAVCYFEGPNGLTGFEYDLAKAFADDLGVELRPLIIEEEADMIKALRDGQADIVAAGIPFGRQSARLVKLGPGYLDVDQQVVGRRGGIVANDVSELSGTTIWMTGSSLRLETLSALKADHEDLTWEMLPDHSTEELLQMVWNRLLPLTMTESHTLTMNQRFYPELVVHFNLGETRKLAWAMHPQSRRLHKAVTRWFNRNATRQFIDGLVDYYFSHLEEFDYVDLARYRRRIYQRLPKYKQYFMEAAAENDLDWHLVAAQAYQESHWNPKAKSFTGVRGIMMLTQDTAKAMGLKNRLEAKDSIFAGARYLAKLHKMVGDNVNEPDRTLMALAAYNIGYGHLQDARVLALRLGKPQDTWHGVRSTLPLLQRKKYYRTVAHGYARGNEAVEYVDRIRTYHKVLLMAMTPEGLYGMKR
jgi:membrane-bound lytic murein transglycosylase F